MGGLSRRGGARSCLAAIALGLLVAGCASAPKHGIVHVVRPGENLYRISRYYQVDVGSLRRANHIRDVTELRIGQRLFVPGARKSQPGVALTPEPGRHAPPKAGDRELALREADLRFAWPVGGRVSSRFGWRSGRAHEGIDIKARSGTPVHAAEAGRVIHSGRLGDYGNVVIVKHAGRYSTVYAHNRKNKVRKGQFVERGEVIATVGSTGNASGSHVHFEVRRDRVAQDPLRYLPDISRSARR